MPDFFPIMSNCREGMSVQWNDAERAFGNYNRKFPGETMERLAERGGFGVEEFVYFYHGFLGPMTGRGWDTDVCQPCRGSGESQGAKCARCLGAGATLPLIHAGTQI